MRRPSSNSLTMSPAEKSPPWYKTEGINGEVFPDRWAVVLRVKAIMGSVAPGERIPEDGEQFLRALLMHHVHYEPTFDALIDGFKVEPVVGADGRVRRELHIVSGEHSVPVQWRKALDT